MSYLIEVPLGDGSFSENLYSSPNNWGVSIPFYTDPSTGSVGFQASIPNPPLVEQIPDSWGAETWRGFDYVPEHPPVCLVGCTPQQPDQQPKPNVVPEPATMLLVASAFLLAMLRRRYVR